MKFSLDFDIKSLNESLRDSILSAVPASNDSKVWNHRLTVSNANGYTIKGNIPFNLEADQLAYQTTVLGLGGVLGSLEVGSTISLHDHNHDEANPASTCSDPSVIFEVI